MIVFVNRQQFAFYLGKSYSRAREIYKLYQDIVEKRRFQELTVQDIAKIDQLSIDQVRSLISGKDIKS